MNFLNFSRILHVRCLYPDNWYSDGHRFPPGWGNPTRTGHSSQRQKRGGGENHHHTLQSQKQPPIKPDMGKGSYNIWTRSTNGVVLVGVMTSPFEYFAKLIYKYSYIKIATKNRDARATIRQSQRCGRWSKFLHNGTNYFYVMQIVFFYWCM